MVTPTSKEENNFAGEQETFRESVKSVFGVRFNCQHILAQPPDLWHSSYMEKIVLVCAILNNMIIECRDADERIDTKAIVSVDPDAEKVPIRSTVLLSEMYQ